MIDFITALKLANIEKDDIVKVIMQSQQKQSAWPDGLIMSRKELTEKFDLRDIKVVKILPWFSYYDYEGTKFIVKDNDQIIREYIRKGYSPNIFSKNK